MAHDFEVGDIIVGSWGYDQTNQEWHQITRVTEKSVWVRALKSETVENAENFAVVAVKPLKDQFLGAQWDIFFYGKEARKVPYESVLGGWRIKFPHWSGRKWDGAMRWETSAYAGH